MRLAEFSLTEVSPPLRLIAFNLALLWLLCFIEFSALLALLLCLTEVSPLLRLIALNLALLWLLCFIEFSALLALLLCLTQVSPPLAWLLRALKMVRRQLSLPPIS